MDDCCRLVLPYNAVYSIQQTGQIPNDPPQKGAKSTTTSNHPSTPSPLCSRWKLKYAFNIVDSSRRTKTACMVSELMMYPYLAMLTAESLRSILQDVEKGMSKYYDLLKRQEETSTRNPKSPSLVRSRLDNWMCKTIEAASSTDIQDKQSFNRNVNSC